MIPSSDEVLQALWFFVPAYLANMAPVLIGDRLRVLDRPMDFGLTLRGRRLLGDHKTWRGFVVGVATGVAVFALQRAIHRAGWLDDLACIDNRRAPLLVGLLLGAGALTGDAVKSLLKRQLDIAPGASWIGFDQLDFLLGAWLFTVPLGAPPFLHVVAIAPIVFLGAIVTTLTGFLLGLKPSWI